MQFDMTEQDTLLEMSKLSEEIPSLSGRPAVEGLKRFVNLYINHQKLSEDFFMSLCEHNILGKLFTSRCSTLEALEIFNLLLSNSNKQPQLVFIFSQHSFHEFFFKKLSIEDETEQTVQYYVQLLKTVILKITPKDNTSLLKLFFNNRYPNFPLLTTTSMLAIDRQHEELVRVTANQCILLLIKLINESGLGLQYLSQPQMLVYYYETAREVLEAEAGQPQQQQIKFLIDLLLSLKANIVARSVLMNLITNLLIFPNVNRPEKILKFISFFYEQMKQNPLFPQELAENITLILFRIISKYYSENTINYTYFTAQRVLTEIAVPERPKLSHLGKFYEDRGKAIEQYLIRETSMLEDQKSLEFILEEWLHFNHKNKELSPLKSQKNKPRSAFEQFFTSKQDIVEEYMQNIFTMAGIQSQKLKSPIHKLSFSSNYQTCIYLVEYVCQKFQDRIDQTKAYEHYYRDQIWQLEIHEELLVELYSIGSRVAKLEIENAKHERKMSSRVDRVRASQRTEKLFGVTSSCYSPSRDMSAELEKHQHEEQLQGFVYFLNHMRPELTTMFCAALTIHEKKLSLSQLALISAIAVKTRLQQSVQTNHQNLLFNKLKELQVYITEDVFAQENHHFVFKYLSKNREKLLLKRVEKGGKDKKEEESPRKMFGHVKERIQKNFIHYEVVKRLLNSSVVSLTEFMKDYWQARFFSKKGTVPYPITQFLYKDSSGIVLEVIADNNFEFCVKKSKINHNQTVIFSISREDCNYDKNNPTYLTLDDHKFLIDLETEEKANNFREDLRKLRNERKQIIMSGILEYLSFSFQSLSANAQFRPEQKSKDQYTTPH